MHISKRFLAPSGVLVLLATLVALTGGAGGTANASTPATGSITVPTAVGQTATDTFTGTIPAGSNATSDCAKLANTPAQDYTPPP